MFCGITEAPLRSLKWVPLATLVCGPAFAAGNLPVPNFAGLDIAGLPAITALPSLGDYFFAGAGNLTLTGTGNIAIGPGAGAALTVPGSAANPQADTVLGFEAGYNLTTARETTAIGYEAGYNLTGTGAGVEDSIDTFIGSFAGYSAVGGTADDVFIGQKAGVNTTGSWNTFIGTHAGAAITTGTYNVVIGFASASFLPLTGTNNVVIGAQAGPSGGSDSDNIFIGANAGQFQSGVSGNIGIGEAAGQSNVTGVEDTLIGTLSGASGGTTSGNTFVGYKTGPGVSGNYNSLMGDEVGSSLTSATFSVAMGWHALVTDIVGNDNTAIGAASLLDTTGADNTGVGFGTLYENTTGSGNTAIGSNTGRGITTGINNTIIGAGVSGLAGGLSDAIILATGEGTVRGDFGKTTAGVWTFAGGITKTCSAMPTAMTIIGGIITAITGGTCT